MTDAKFTYSSVQWEAIQDALPSSTIPWSTSELADLRFSLENQAQSYIVGLYERFAQLSNLRFANRAEAERIAELARDLLMRASDYWRLSSPYEDSDEPLDGKGQQELTLKMLNEVSDYFSSWGRSNSQLNNSFAGRGQPALAIWVGGILRKWILADGLLKTSSSQIQAETSAGFRSVPSGPLIRFVERTLNPAFEYIGSDPPSPDAIKRMIVNYRNALNTRPGSTVAALSRRGVLVTLLPPFKSPW